jgi:hypothetical protein
VFPAGFASPNTADLRADLFFLRSAASKNRKKQQARTNFGEVPMTRIKARIVLFAIATTLAFLPVAQATCSNATLKGAYGMLNTGRSNGTLKSSVDRIVFDGAGNLKGSAVKSVGGILKKYNITGTYSVAGDCSGSATFVNPKETRHINFYLDQGNNGGFGIQTDSGRIESGYFYGQGAPACTNQSVQHVYAFRLTGTVNTQGDVAAVGTLSFDGAGGLTGVANLSVNGTIFSSLPLTGTYQINSDCTGSAKFIPQGKSTFNLYLLVIAGGKTMMSLETDAGTIVAGELRQ